MTDLRFTSRFAALVLAGGLIAGCSSPSPTQIDYKSDSKSKQASLAVPPNLLEEAPDQRSLPRKADRLRFQRCSRYNRPPRPKTR